MIEAHCEYKSGARYDDEIEIRTRGAAGVAGAAGVRLRAACGAATALLIASGYTVHVTIDRIGRPVRLPARVRELFA